MSSSPFSDPTSHSGIDFKEEQALSLDEAHWTVLLASVRAKRCTPFLGAGASSPPLPRAAELAETLAQAEGYPLENRRELSSVAQFLQIKYDDTYYPKSQIQNHFRSIPAPNFTDKTQLHSLLANLNLPVYLTTNYDDYMERALATKGRTPRAEICRWNNWVRKNCESAFDKQKFYEPSDQDPVVFHLHGHLDYPDSLVLTEDDYVDFLVEMHQMTLPPRIEGALSQTNVLFLGYGLNDWNFRVLFRTMATYLGRSTRPGHVSVQLVPPPPDKKLAVLNYLNQYFNELDIRVYWGTCQQFAKELSDRIAAV